MAIKQRIAREWVFQVLILVFSGLTAFLAGPFFLMPYYAIYGDERYYDSEVGMTLPPGKYMFSVKTTTGIPNLHLDYALNAALFANRTSQTTCPNGFRSDLLDQLLPTSPRKPKCVRQYQRVLKFIQITPSQDEDKKNYRGPRERPFQVNEFFFQTFDDPDGGDGNTTVSLALDILRFNNSNPTHCQTTKHCLEFQRNIMDLSSGPDKNIFFDRESLRCVPDYQRELYGAQYTGCAISVHIGDLSTCFVNAARHRTFDPFNTRIKHTRGECALTMYWEVFKEPPHIFTWSQVWSWGTIGMISSFFLYLFSVLYYWYRIHMTYLSFYYFRNSRLSLQPGIVYDFKIHASGEQYTKRTGLFRIYSRDSLIYEKKLTAIFEEEDVEGGKMCSCMFSGQFQAEHQYAGARYDVTWAGEFHRAGFRVPVTKVLFRVRIPPRVKTKWNVLFCPFFFLYSVIARKPPRREFVKYRDYVYLVIMLSAVYVAVLLAMVYALFTYLGASQADPNLRTAFWGTPNTHPPLPIPFYFLYIVLVFVPFFMSLLPSCRPQDYYSRKFWYTIPSERGQGVDSRVGKGRDGLHHRRGNSGHLGIEYIALGNPSPRSSISADPGTGVDHTGTVMASSPLAETAPYPQLSESQQYVSDKVAMDTAAQGTWSQDDLASDPRYGDSHFDEYDDHGGKAL